MLWTICGLSQNLWGVVWFLEIKIFMPSSKRYSRKNCQGYNHWARRYSGALGPLGRGHCMALRSDLSNI